MLGAAADDPLDLDAVYVTARNYHGMRLVRGEDWRYLEDDGTEEVAVKGDGDAWQVRPDHALAGVGRSIASNAARTDRERRRIVEAADAMAAG